MYRRGPWCDFHCANHYMGLSRTTALRPRDWPKDMVVRAAEFAARLPEPAGSFAMTYLHFLDGGDWQLALTWLDKARQAARAGSKLALALTIDRAYLEAFHRRDGREAQRLFEQAPPREDSIDYWRARATVQATQGNFRRGSHLEQSLGDGPKTSRHRHQRYGSRTASLVGVWLEELRAQPVSA